MPTKTEKSMKAAELIASLRTNEVSDIRVPVQWLDYHLPNPKDQREYARERCRVVVTEAIGEALEKNGLSRVEVARKLGVTKGHISQVLSGARNMTLHTLGDLLWACGVELHDLETRELGVIMAPVSAAEEWTQSCKVAVTYETVGSPLTSVLSERSSTETDASANLALAA